MTRSEEDAGGMINLTIDGQPFPLLPRAEAMVKLIFTHQREFDRQATGQVEFNLTLVQVTMTHRVKLGVRALGAGERQ